MGGVLPLRGAHPQEEVDMRFPIALFAALTPALALAQGASTAADMVVINARIYTVDDNRPMAEALAVRGGRIAFVGSAQCAL